MAEVVSSYGIELGDDMVLFDPLAVPDELRERSTAVVLTAPYHERDSRRLASRCTRETPPPGRAGSRKIKRRPDSGRHGERDLE